MQIAGVVNITKNGIIEAGSASSLGREKRRAATKIKLLKFDVSKARASKAAPSWRNIKPRIQPSIQPVIGSKAQPMSIKRSVMFHMYMLMQTPSVMNRILISKSKGFMSQLRSASATAGLKQLVTTPPTQEKNEDTSHTSRW